MDSYGVAGRGLGCALSYWHGLGHDSKSVACTAAGKIYSYSYVGFAVLMGHVAECRVCAHDCWLPTRPFT